MNSYITWFDEIKIKTLKYQKIRYAYAKILENIFTFEDRLKVLVLFMKIVPRIFLDREIYGKCHSPS